MTFLYDANGNTIEKNDNGNITKYFYNIEDRLVRVEDGAGAVIATYYYDPFGRRLWKEVDGIRTYFVYSDEGLVGEYDSAGSEIRSYGYRPGSTWTTDPLFLKENGAYYFYQNDHLGTPQKMIGVNGAVVWSGRYSSFGKAEIDPSSAITNNLRFPGQYSDSETELHYNYFRYYATMTGRYLRTDPFGLWGDIALFVYADSNPANIIDNLGLVSDKYAKYIRRHGNYCGPGYCGGKEIPQGGKCDYSTTATDSLDSCCKKHDKCYEDSNVTSGDESDCKKLKCDKDLLDCLGKLNSWPTEWEDPVPNCSDVACTNVLAAIGYRREAEVFFKYAVKKGREKMKKDYLKPCK